VAENNTTKRIPSPSAHPTGVFRSPSQPQGGEAFTILLGEVCFYIIYFIET